MIIRYYPDTPVASYPYRHYTREDGTITGTMPVERFLELKDSIQQDGILNPLIVEFYKMEGLEEAQLCIRLGHNRAAILDQLGIETAPILFVVPDDCKHMLPQGEYTNIPVVRGTALLSALRHLWSEVPRAESGEFIGFADAWMESELLLTTVRACLPDPNQLHHQRVRT